MNGQLGAVPQSADAAPASGSRLVEWAVRIVVVVGLAVDAFVHFDLAESQQLAAPGGIGGGTLFRLQAGLASLVAVLLLVSGRRWAYALALLTGLSALVPVLLYTYVDLPAIGPIPPMYDPYWYPEKVLSAVAEALVVLGSAAGWVLCRRRTRQSPTAPIRFRRKTREIGGVPVARRPR